MKKSDDKNMQCIDSIVNAFKKIKFKKSVFKKLNRYKFFYLLSALGLIYFFIYHYLPMTGILIAFKQIQPFMTIQQMLKAPWVGLKNFTNFINGYYFWNVLGNTLAISIYSLLFGFTLPIILAVLINEINENKFKKTAQTILYMPHFLSWVIVAGLVRIIFSTSDGIVNQIVIFFTNKPVFFLGDNKYIRSLIVGSGIWKETGWNMIIYLAAITGIDQTLYEAANVDGATRFQKIWHITLPGMKFAISLIFIMSCGRLLDAGFERVMMLYSPATYAKADIIDTYVYRASFGDMQYSFATAVNLFKSIISLLLVLSANWASKKLGENGLW